MVLRLLAVLISSALVGWAVAVGATVLSAFVVRAWSGDNSFVNALTWMSLETWGFFGGLLGLSSGIVAYVVWLRRVALTDLFRAAPTLIGWTILGSAVGAVLLFPLTLV